MLTNKYFITTRKIPTYIKYLIAKKGGQTVHEVTSTTGIFYTDMIAPLKRLLVSFEPIQSGSGTPSPTNVRPIEGKTELIIRHSGVNIWDEEWELGSLSNSTGEKVSSSNSIRSKNFIPVRPNTQYYFSNLAGYVLQYDQNKRYIGILANRNTNPTDATCYYLMFRLSTNYGTVYKNDYSINYPATVTEYEQYKGNTYTTDLGQTVYGGTLDVVSGLLTVDRVKETFVFDNPTEDTTYNLESQRFTLAQRSTGASIATNKITNVCGNYAYAQSSWQEGEPHFYIGTTACIIYLTKNAYRGGDVEVCYPLETPITYQLTPQQINTLAGNNIVTVDDGNLVELVYLTHTFKEELQNQYKSLEYIESTGTQYIDTLINGEATWIAKFQGVSTTRSRSACLVTNEDGVEAGKGKWLGYNSSGKWGTSGNNFTTINYNEQVDINAEFKREGITVTINGVELTHSTKLIFTNETWKLLSGSTSCPSSVRCYKASCYKENVLVGNFIPALRISDNKPGMYDTVTETFFVNQGTGEFSY